MRDGAALAVGDGVAGLDGGPCVGRDAVAQREVRGGAVDECGVVARLVVRGDGAREDEGAEGLDDECGCAARGGPPGAGGQKLELFTTAPTAIEFPPELKEAQALTTVLLARLNPAPMPLLVQA